MLRRLGYGLTASLVVLVLAWAGSAAIERFQGARDGGKIPADSARPTRVYQLAADDWTRFPLSRPVDRLRILAHADRPADGVNPSLNEPVDFAIRIQVVGSKGEPILDRVHHFQARLSWNRAPKDEGSPRPGKFYADRSPIPTDTQRAVLDLRQADAMSAVRIKRAETGAGVRSVHARVYAPRRLSGAKRRNRWVRLSAEQRSRLAEGNVYRPELLSASERAELSAVRWHRLAPAGVAGDGYRQRTLYVREERDTAWLAEPVAPEGVRVGPRRRATVRLPEDRGRFSIVFTALAPGEGSATAIAYAGADGEVAREAVAWRGETVRIEDAWPGRLLELRSDVPAVVRLLPRAGADPPPQPDAGIVRVYSADAGPSWRVRHPGQRPTPFRVDLRCRCFGPDGRRLASGAARIELLASDGAVIERHPVTVTAALSLYDQVRQGDEDVHVSESRSVYFRLPDEVAALRVIGDGGVFAAAFNRPARLRRTIRVPEGRYARDPDALRQHRSWFYLPPADIAPDSPASTVVSVQEPPPEIDPLIQAGNYDWTAYRPQGDWVARRLLTPTDPPDPERRPEALAATYTELSAGTTHEVKIDAASPRPVRPDLVFTRTGADRATLRVDIDGEESLTRDLRAPTGRLTLPEMRLGRHRIRIRSEGEARFYVSNVTRGGGGAYSLSLVNRIQPGTTRFIYDKTSPDATMLSFRFYPQRPTTGRQQLDVDIGQADVADAGPHADLTLRRRRYDVRLDAEPRNRVIGGGGGAVGAERRFVATLGADLPPGRYPITIHYEGPREAFMRVSTATPGRSETREIRRGGSE